MNNYKGIRTQLLKKLKKIYAIQRVVYQLVAV